MESTAFCEESQIINRADYMKMKKEFTTKKADLRIRTIKFQKIFFGNEIKSVLNQLDNNADVYCIKIDMNKNYCLEKISKRNNTIYERSEEISEEQFKNICMGDILFLFESDKELYRDLYLQLTINKLEITQIYEYTREVMEFDNGRCCVLFDKSIKVAHIDSTMVFKDDYLMEEKVKLNELVVRYRQQSSLPTFIAKIFNINFNLQANSGLLFN